MANGAEFRESVTTLYELLYELGVIEKKGIFYLDSQGQN